MNQKALNASREALRRAGLWEMVKASLAAERFEFADLLGHSRFIRRLNRLRFRIWHTADAMRDASNRRLYSYPELGRLFNRNHSTIMSGVAQWQADMQSAGAQDAVTRSPITTD